MTSTAERREAEKLDRDPVLEAELEYLVTVSGGDLKAVIVH